MKCDWVQERLLFYIDGELPTRDAEQIKAHLSNCSECEQKHLFNQETHKALLDLGEAVQAGRLSMEAPPFPPVRRRSLWAGILRCLEMPVPLWIPSAASVALLLMFATIIFSPLPLSIQWGSEEETGNTGAIGPPLSAEGMLEFLIVPDPTDAGQLLASIEAIETFLKAHPEDLAMHAKLIELYRSQLELQSSSTERTALKEKLSSQRERSEQWA